MSNIAVSTLAMKAAMIGTRNLGESHAFAARGQHASWPSRRAQFDAGRAHIARRKPMPLAGKQLAPLVAVSLV